MYKHILIATDGSELAGKAVADALALAKALDAKVTAVTVTDIFPTGPYSSIPLPSMIDRYEAAAVEAASRILSSVSASGQQAGCRMRNHAHQGSSPGGRNYRRGK